MRSVPGLGSRARGVAVVGVALLASVAVTACGAAKSGGGGGSKAIQMYISGDTNVRDLWANQIVPGFVKANKGYSVHITFSAHGANDTQTLAGIAVAVRGKKKPAFDLVEGGIPLTMAQNKWSLPVTTDKVPGLAQVPAELRAPALGQAVAYRGTTVVLAYNSKFVSSAPKTLPELISWIKAHPGKFAYNTPDSGGSGGSFVETVLDQYVPESVRTKMDGGDYTAGERYWTKGLAELKSLKPFMYQKTYTSGNQGTLDLLGQEHIYMAPVWVDQTLTGIGNGSIPKTVKLTQVSSPSFTGGGSYLGAPKTTAAADADYKLMNYVLTPTVQATIAKVLSGFPVISFAKLPAAIQAKFSGVANPKFRLAYQSMITSDMNQKWQHQVA